MKKLFTIILFILLSASAAFAQNHIISSGLTTSSAAIVASPCLFHGVEIITDGSNAATVTVYDNASAASGTVVFKGTVAGASNFGGAMFPNPVEMFNGIYVGVSGTGAAYIPYWKKR